MNNEPRKMIDQEAYDAVKDLLWRDPDEIKDDWNFGRYDNEVATKAGLLCAFVFDYIFRKIKYDKENTFEQNGKTWIKLSIDEWNKIIVFHNPKSIKKGFRRLKHRGLIDEMLAPDGTKCFSVNHDNVTKLLNGRIYTA